MDGVNKTLYIPLYGKAYVSKKGIILEDKKAEEIWDAEGFSLRGKSKSKWLAYYMGMRASVFDGWVSKQISANPEAVVIHIGCGMDSRVLRVNVPYCAWYDVDFPEVIAERRKYFAETDSYRMIAGDATEDKWLSEIHEAEHAIIVMEGVCMYLSDEEIRGLFSALSNRFARVSLLMDCYTPFGAKMTKIKNPINDVGVTDVYGIDEPRTLECSDICFIVEHAMTPEEKINELRGLEKFIFKALFAGGFAKKLYRLYEYSK